MSRHKLAPEGKAERVQITMARPLLALVDAMARRAGLTRSALLARLARKAVLSGGWSTEPTRPACSEVRS